MDICKQCGKEFRGGSNNANNYCGRVCYWESLKGKPTWNTGLTHKEDPRVAQPWLGKSRDPKTMSNLQEGRKKVKGKNHFAWKGDDVSYGAMHHWVNRHYKKTLICEFCNKAGNSRQIQWANKTGNYLREDRNDWLELCASCHKCYDLAMKANNS